MLIANVLVTKPIPKKWHWFMVCLSWDSISHENKNDELTRVRA
jgi:hypothetical protein